MIKHNCYSDSIIRNYIRSGEICLAGNIRARIFGSLNCTSGKRMKKENRIFFKSESEAILAGFRPCSHCLRYKYVEWKKDVQ